MLKINKRDAPEAILQMFRHNDYSYYTRGNMSKFLTFSGLKMCDKNGNFCLYLKIVEKDPFLRLQNETYRRLQSSPIFFTNKQYVKIKLMQNETNR